MGLFSSLLNPFKSRKKLLDPLNLRRRALDPAGLLRDKNPPRKPTNPLMAKPGNRPGRMPRADFGAKPIGYSPRENSGKPQMMAKPISIAESERLGQEAIAAAASGGYKTVILDSLTHAWNGTGGMLDIVDAIAKRSQMICSASSWPESNFIAGKVVPHTAVTSKRAASPRFSDCMKKSWPLARPASVGRREIS
mgnify:CR=1 FL=1